MLEPTKVEPRHTTILNGQERTVFMSFGLINTLTNMFENVEQIPELFTNPMLRGVILVKAFSERDEHGKITKELNIQTLEIEDDAFIEFVEWVEVHVTNFFIKTSNSNKKRQLRLTQALKKANS